MGFAYPCNQAAKTASGDYLAFVNNDMKLDKSWLKEMLKYIDHQNNRICVASKILNADGTKIDFIGGGVNYIGRGYQKHFGKDAALFDEKESKDLLFACGGAMLVDKKIYLETGGFDEDFFAFFEDVDFGWRLWILGYKVVFAPTAVGYHRHHQTAKKIPQQVLMTLYEKNSLYTIYKNYDNENLKKVFPAALLLSARRLLDLSGIDTSEYLIGTKNINQRKNNAVQSSYRNFISYFLNLFASFLLDLRFNTRVLIQNKRKKSMSKAKSSLACFSPAVAAAQFGLNLERMKEKRKFIQKNRKLSDAEINMLFNDSFGMESKSPTYHELGKILKEMWD
jgi:GT2 family glycosyltransferase